MTNKKSLSVQNQCAKNLSLFVFSLALISFPYIVSAAGLVPCGNPGEPACNFSSLTGLINGIINWFLGISVTVAAITFAIAGARMLFNPGKEAEQTAAKDMFFKTIIGLFIILCAWLVIHTIIATLVPSGNGALRFLGN